MKRIYSKILDDHFENNRQMAFVSGPRQVGKTTVARSNVGDSDLYLNWDRQRDRRFITSGPEEIAIHAKLDHLETENPMVVFDELHKYGRWKNFLKGFFDTYHDQCRILVTGSSRMDVYKRGGDSLMGRYFLYRMHPLSPAELTGEGTLEAEIQAPSAVKMDVIETLLQFGGFPESLSRGTTRFYNRWSRLRMDQLVREDLRDLTRIQELGQVAVLAELLQNQAGALCNMSTLAKQVNAAVDTIQRWIAALESLYFCFSIRPWFKNVAKSLRKQPKIYLWDWSHISDPGAKRENFIASMLLKSVHFWTDIGLGNYKLHYLRDKTKREVDFLIVKDGIPWFLVEVKSSGAKRISPALVYFHRILGTTHAIQVVFDGSYVEKDCFGENRPIIAPVQTFLSQLV